LPLLRFPARTDDLDEIGKARPRLRAGATDVVVLGVGGSSLGGQTLAQLADVGVRGIEAFRAGPRLHFMDNLDPATYGTCSSSCRSRPRASSRSRNPAAPARP
jgi:glucose-6-phosphate isomerase